MATRQSTKEISVMQITRKVRLALGTGLVALAGLGLPAAATAATVQTVAIAGTTTEEVSVTAAAGETNTIVLTGDVNSLKVTDTGTAPTAGNGCQADGANAVICKPAAGNRLVGSVAMLGDAKDSWTSSASLPGVINVNGGAEDDTLTGGPGRDWLLGDTGVDTIDGGDGPDELAGGNDDDKVTGGNGADLVAGGDGVDTLSGGSDDDTVDGGNGNDTLSAGDGGDRLCGGDGNDTLNGDAGSDEFSPYCAGGFTTDDDTLNGGGGNDSWGGPHDDPGKDVFNGGSGEDFVSYGGYEEGVNLSADGTANDGPAGTAEPDNVAADVEQLRGTAYDDTLSGGPGNDILNGDTGNDTLSGNGGADQIYAAGGDDTAKGGDGRDLLWDGSGRDTLSGEGGDDTLETTGDGQPDVLDGGADNDWADFSDTDGTQYISLDGAANDGFLGEGDNVQNTENVIGGDDGDVISGSPGRNIIDGQDGNDVITVSGDPGAIDQVTCGEDIDTATIDADDNPATTGVERCETVNGAGVQSAPVAVPVPRQVPVPQLVPDTKAPTVTAKLGTCPTKRASFVKGCTVSVTADEIVAFRAVMTTGSVILAEGSSKFGTAAGTKTLKLRPDKRYLNKVRARSTKVRIVLTVTDRYGNEVTRTLNVTVRR